MTRSFLQTRRSFLQTVAALAVVPLAPAPPSPTPVVFVDGPWWSVLLLRNGRADRVVRVRELGKSVTGAVIHRDGRITPEYFDVLEVDDTHRRAIAEYRPTPS